MTHSAYQIIEPEKRLGSVVFASPHSGRSYFWQFLEQSLLDEREIRSSEDAFIDLLFSDAPEMGAPLLLAQAPRAYIDMNRGKEELDPGLIRGVRASTSNHNPRVASGLGVVPRVVANGRAIYRGKISQQDVQQRIGHFWQPYHEALQDLLDDSRATFGEAILVDCHSMPHEAIESITTLDGRIPDVVLGDRFGAAARSDIVERIEEGLVEAGLQVARNTPFAGAYIAQHYGRPSRNQHVVQLEINRALYMNESEISPSSNFENFRSVLNRVIPQIIAVGVQESRLAAE